MTILTPLNYNWHTLNSTYLTSPFDDDSSIGGKTSKGHHNMVIENTDFLHSSFVLKLGLKYEKKISSNLKVHKKDAVNWQKNVQVNSYHSLFFDTKNDNIFSSDTNCCGSLFDGFLSIFNLGKNTYIQLLFFSSMFFHLDNRWPCNSFLRKLCNLSFSFWNKGIKFNLLSDVWILKFSLYSALLNFFFIGILLLLFL